MSARRLGAVMMLAIGGGCAGLVFAAPPHLFAAPQDPAAARRHWAYQPIHRPTPPSIQPSGQAHSPIDQFLLEKLAARGLGFARPADARALLRRVYDDLIGLPPTFAELEQFSKDNSLQAYARVVDRLLSSPRYGERWGRHWLDVARYADTKDQVLVYGKDRVRPFAYTYRDYVIRAFNEDLPFNRFILEQLAADQLQPEVQPWRLAALGFLTLGRLYDNNQNDQIDDQIDTVTRGFLGLTVACARCHDHKYNAIPMADYYGLYGVFANCDRPYDLPLIEDPAQVPGGVDFEKQFALARTRVENLIKSEYEKLTSTAREHIADYLVRVATTAPDLTESATFFLSLAPEDLRPGLVNRWRRFLEQPARKEDPVFALWTGLMALSETNFAAQARQRIEAQAQAHPETNSGTASGATASVATRLNGMVLQALERASLTNKADLARLYGDLFRQAYARDQLTRTNLNAPPLSGDERQLLAWLTGKESPLYFPISQTRQHMSRVEKDKFGGMVKELDKLAIDASNRPPARAMVVRDAAEVIEPRILIRGSPAQPGEPVPRAFLHVLSGQHRRPFLHGSGRLDLAAAIAAPDNPLTARVLVNRIWMHHFGAPLVNSPGDFGARSDPPTHPELLDWLTWTFQHDGWSLKRLHRVILLSTAYQQSSDDLPAARAVDPENQLLWHFPRRRLDLESMRDTLLFVSGRLDEALFGPSTDIAGDPLNRRRTVYGLVDRQDLPALFRTFDFAVPDACVERRTRTTVPQQALFALNAPFILEQAQALAARPEVLLEPDPARRVNALYRRVLGRRAAPDELAQAMRFIEAAQQEASPPEALPPWAQLAQVLLMSNELMFID